MDNITQQMNAFTLSSGVVNKSDDDDFNAGLFKYLLFIASNVGKEIIVWSEADPELKKWVTKIRSQLKASQLSEDRIKVLNHVNFPRSLHEKKWNRHYEELVEFHALNGHCNVHRACCLGQWVNNQRRSKTNGKLSAERIALLDGLSFGWSRVEN